MKKNKKPKIRIEIKEAHCEGKFGIITIKYYVSVTARNGKKLLTSQMYKHHKSALHLLRILEGYVTIYE